MNVHDQESEIKANQCKTIVTFDNTPVKNIGCQQYTNITYKNLGLLHATLLHDDIQKLETATSPLTMPSIRLYWTSSQ